MPGSFTVSALRDQCLVLTYARFFHCVCSKRPMFILDVCLVLSLQPLYSETGLPGVAITGQSAGLSLLSDPHRLDTVKAAADNIIKEKDTIIEQ